MRQVPWLPPSEFDALRALDQMLPPDTRKFREWFEGSEVIRKTSSIPEISNVRPQDPLVVYHGTRSPDLFTAFNVGRKLPRRGGYGFMKERSNDPNVFYGAHFTDQVEIARDFAMATYGWIKKTPQDVPRVYPVYLSIQNPVAYEAEHLLHYDIARLAMEAGYRVPRTVIADLAASASFGELVTRDLVSVVIDDPAQMLHDMREDEEFKLSIYELALDHYMEFHIVEYALKMVRKAKERLIELGHDGIWYTNEGEGGNGWIAFHANQIKSAIANDGTYGPSKDIRRNPN